MQKMFIPAAAFFLSMSFIASANAMINAETGKYACQHGYTINYTPNVLSVTQNGKTQKYSQLPEGNGWDYRIYRADDVTVKLYLTDVSNVMLTYSNHNFAKCAKGYAPADNE